jgi:L,D-peptidoglycan transpeptidase YkuD (ErfK/YbiS/YcfS/YnhG family)
VTTDRRSALPERRDIEMRHRHRTHERVSGKTIALGAGIALAVVVIVIAVVIITFPRPTSPSSSTAGGAGGTPKATSAAGGTHTPLPLGMARVLPGSRQLVVATGPAPGATSGTLRVYQFAVHGWKRVLSVKCRFGSGGLEDGAARKQGSRMTPTGIWWPGKFAWGTHATAPSGSAMPYRQITPSTWWSAESGSTFNTWVDSTQQLTGEHLADGKVQYEYAWSTGYNAPPNEVVEGRGIAVFLRMFDPPNYTGGLSPGSVSVSRADMMRVLRAVDPALRPCFAVGSETTGTPTSIAGY